MANNNGILINYGSEEVVGATDGLVPGKTATLNTSGHLLNEDITVAFPSEYVIPEGSLDIKDNGTGINVAGKATVNVQVPVPDTNGVNAIASQVLEGKIFYGADGKDTGIMPNYYGGDFVQVLDASKTSISLDGAYKGEVYIDIKNPTTITANGTYRATSETVMTEVTVEVPSPEVWDKSYTI